MSRDLPTGTVTFLFTDIEGSTALLTRLGEVYPRLLETHRSIVLEAIGSQGGTVFGTEGDAAFAAFGSAKDAVAAAVDIQRAHQDHEWPKAEELRVRIGIHTGDAEIVADDYVGIAVHTVARVCSAAHGGQALVSAATRDVLGEGVPEGVELRDLGPHRLKDLGPARTLHQLVHPTLRRDFPPLRTLDARPNNLPIRRTSFVGRESERVELAKLVSEAPLVTLTGAGGTGKTRLALEVGAELTDTFPDGVWFVDLAPISDPELVPGAVTVVLDVREAGDPVDALTAHLARRRALLLLDNCEHLVDACAALADHLLADCTDLRVLATSREVLGVSGEQVYTLAPLERPDPDSDQPVEALAAMPSVRLFCDRARAVKHDFALTDENAGAVARICHRLDGMPLALELAAARLKMLSPSEVAERLDDRFGLLVSRDRAATERQRTLRDLVHWSYDLLSEEERRLLRGVSVFAGGFTLDAVADVCAPDADDDDVLDLIAGLVDKSLVSADSTTTPTRYSMLETIREYAWEKAADAGETDALDTRHAAHFRELAARGSEELKGPDQGGWFALLDADRDNLRQSLAWFAHHEDPAAGRMALDLATFWERRGYAAEGRRWLEAGLEIIGDEPTEERAQMLVEAGTLARNQGDHDHAHTLLSDALSISRHLGADRATGRALSELGILAHVRSRYSEARALLTEGLDMARGIDDRRVEATTLQSLGTVAQEEGDYAEGRQWCEESVEVWRSTRDPHGLAGALNDLGGIAYQEGDTSRARELWTESLAQRRELGDRARLVAPLVNLGVVHLNSADHEEADRYLREALAMARRSGEAFTQELCLYNLGIVAEERGEYRRARDLLTESLAVGRRIGTRRTVTAASRGLGRIEVVFGDLTAARAHLDEALDVARDIGTPLETFQALRDLAWVAINEDALEEAQTYVEEASGLQETLGNPILRAEVDALRGLLAHRRDEFDDARRLYESCLSAFEEAGAPTSVAWQLSLLGDLALAMDDLGEAGARFRACLETIGELGPGSEEAVEGLAAVATHGGDNARAARLLGVAEALRERIGAPVPAFFRETVQGAEQRALDALGRSGFEQAWAEGRGMSPSRAFEYALTAEAEEQTAPPGTAPPATAYACAFHLEGDFWTVGHPGDEVRLRDTKGMGYVAQLLARPGRELHVLDMVAALEGHAPVRPQKDPELGQATGHAGELLDPEAKEAYRQRIEELRAEIEDAEAWNDPERAARATEELDAIADQLASGVGLGGRDRRASDDAERARGSVSKAIKSALKRLTTEHPEIGKRLEACISTGTFCSYTPDPRDPIDWAL